MINFFRIFNIFEKIRTYFIKIIKPLISPVKKILSLVFGSIIKFIHSSKNIFHKVFKFKNSQIIKQTFNKFRNFQKKISKFFNKIESKNKIKIFFQEKSRGYNENKLLKKSIEKEINVKNFFFLSHFECIEKEKIKESQNCLSDQEELPITRKIVENYLFWLQFKKQRKDIKVAQNCNFPKIFDYILDILQYLFVLILQFIFLTIFASLNLCCNIIYDIISSINKRIQTAKQSIPEKFEFKNFDSLFNDSRVLIL